MGITISNGTTTSTPQAVLGYSSARESMNVVHEIPGRSAAPVTLLGARLRNGTLQLHYATTAAALAAQQLLAGVDTFTLTDTDQPTLGLTFVLDGELRLEQNSSRRTWQLWVPFREVGA